MKFKSAVVLIISLLVTGHAQSREITTQEIIEAITPDPSCHGWCLTGACVWLRCSLYECQTGVVNKVRNKNPDFLVTVFDEQGDEPWTEMQDIWGGLSDGRFQSIIASYSNTLAGGGQSLKHSQGESEFAYSSGLKFKEVNVYGHPLALAFGQNMNSDSVTYWCPTQVTPFLPYFSSAIDSFEWRWGAVESLYPATWVPGMRVIGSGFLQQWGSVFPRTGYVDQKEDAKAAAIVAQRAGNIVTSQNALPHLSIPLQNNNGVYRTWFSGEMRENDPVQTVWQMVSPQQDTQCYAFGENDLAGLSWASQRQNRDGKQQYAFTAWRNYECCQIPGVLIANITFDQPICVGATP